jgi:hypothetical protein
VEKIALAREYFGLMSEWASRTAAPNPEYLVPFDNGDGLIEYWSPRAIDDQLPHDCDEVYVLLAGSSEFAMGSEQRTVKSGDLIFVPAGMPHRFLDFSEDLAVWIIFFGRRHEGLDPTP